LRRLHIENSKREAGRADDADIRAVPTTNC
jgi:hypothetical protein